MTSHSFHNVVAISMQRHYYKKVGSHCYTIQLMIEDYQGQRTASEIAIFSREAISFENEPPEILVEDRSEKPPEQVPGDKG